MNDVEQLRGTLQEAMNFASALACAIEKLVGGGAGGMTFAAGRRLGKEFSAGAKKTSDLDEALNELQSIFEQNNFQRSFERFKPKKKSDFISVDDKGRRQIDLVFRDCMIRQSLFCFGHEQKGSLCSMTHGFFSGALENIMGKRSTLDIVHAGENACIKRLIVEG